MDSNTSHQHVFGMIGLGTMGRNLLLNMADHGFNVTGYDKNEGQVKTIIEEGEKTNTLAFTDIKEFVKSIKTPRAIMMLVPAGPIVDQVIEELIPLLSEGDIIIDGGNSHFTDTERRVDFLKAQHIHFFGMGISGGEKGARFGPSLMPGGDKHAYETMRPILEAVAAKVNGEPCVTYIGPGASGHFVKMVHNGIEYAIMALISEAYELMKSGIKLSDKEIGAVFNDWNKGRLQSYLLEITATIFKHKEPGDQDILINYIKDEAKSKSTGKWTSQEAMDLQAVATAIDTAVAMRDLSKQKELRVKAAELYGKSIPIETDQKQFLVELEQAMYFSIMITYAQGMEMLQKASIELNYKLNLSDCAKIWRGGCIIRAAFLEEIYQAFKKEENLPNLLADKKVVEEIKKTVTGARNTAVLAINASIAIPVFTATLSYFDSLKTGRMPSNLIQAQRDYFGAHTYERIDKEGTFHTKWD